jgi:methionyl-tRNA formyltransferase
MKVLLLGPLRSSITDVFAAAGDQVAQTEEPIHVEHPLMDGVDFLVSYGYRHMIRPDLLAKYPKRIINLHISYLPYNRGADPNLWSIIDGTPTGITIHEVDKGLDTGGILEQRIVNLLSGDTLKTSYQRLSQAIEKLFAESWSIIRTGRCDAIPQRGEGSVHKLKDRALVEHLLPHGWDTPILTIQEARRTLLQEELI